MVWRRSKKNIRVHDLNPDEILLDARNLPSFDRQQFEGTLEKPITKRPLKILWVVMVLIGSYFVFVLAKVQIGQHNFYVKKSEQNSLTHVPLFADRGLIYDRNGVELVSNTIDETLGLTKRSYTKEPGFANILGYVLYPAKDDKGVFWRERTMGKDGVEKQFDAELAGHNGTQLIETNVSGDMVSGGVVDPPVQGDNIELSIDARIQGALYGGIRALAEQSGYVGGTGLVMDIHTGELYALTTYPEYNSTTLSDATDKATIAHYLTSSSRPLLNRAIDGLYTPGSIVKPFLAVGAMEEGIISPDKTIFSDGTLEVPNPYNPKAVSVFKDNKAHGAVDMRKALAVSSNIYFYEIGGGYGSQKGLGIANIGKYTKLFGIGQKTGSDVGEELSGNIPSVEWKAKRFPGDPWRIGDTYNTAIGQYGFQVTPIQMVRAIAGIASRGTLYTPTLRKLSAAPKGTTLDLKDSSFTPVHQGMRMGVLEGTTTALKNDTIAVAAKSGTAQIKNNTRVNSWVEGFFPYEHPQFAFVVLMEDGPKVSSGAVHAFKPVLDVFIAHPELLSR